MRRVLCVVACAAMLMMAFAEAAQAGASRDVRGPGSRSTADARFRPGVTCSSALQLYDGTSLSGPSFSVYTRGVWIDLSPFGFDNKTSSYRVGACAIELASGSGGSGSRYPRCLYAGCVENTMASGWNNVVSSVYLH